MLAENSVPHAETIRSAALRNPPARRDGSSMAGLRAHIGAIEFPSRGPGWAAPVLSVGAPEIDAALPWGGLPLGALHEVIEAAPSAGVGFTVALLARLATRMGGQVLWCLGRRSLYESGNLYAPGLAAFGLGPERLIVARGQTDADVLWAMEEGLRSRALAAVLAETGALDLATSRRLQLAAEASGVTGFLLRPCDGRPAPTAAVTRWRLAAAPSEAAGRKTGAAVLPCWRAALERCRGGAPRAWLMEWRHETTEAGAGLPGRLSVVAELRDGPAEAQDLSSNSA